MMNRDRCTLFLHDVTVYFFHIFIVKNIQLSTLASTVIKLNHSGIIFRENDEPGIVFPGNVSSGNKIIWETFFQETSFPGKWPSGNVTIRETTVSLFNLVGELLKSSFWSVDIQWLVFAWAENLRKISRDNSTENHVGIRHRQRTTYDAHTTSLCQSWHRGVAPQPRVAGRMRPVFKINTTEQQHCLHWNRLHIRSVSSPQFFEVDSHPEAEELDDDVEID